jgi:hypothetical protein
VDGAAPEHSEATAAGQPDQATPAVVPSGWVQSGAEPGPSRGARRLVAAVVWLVAIGLLALAGWVAALAIEPSQTSWRLAYVAAAVGGGLALAACIRWIWIRVRQHGQGALSSTWTAVVAMVLAISGLSVAFADATTVPPPVNPATVMRVGPGYVLEDTEPGLEADIRASLADVAAESRSLVIKTIVGDDGSTGIFVVADLGVPAMLEEVMLELVMFGAEADATTDVDAQRETLAGRQIFIADVEGDTIVGWVDSPLIALVFAADEPTGRAMVESVLRAGD